MGNGVDRGFNHCEEGFFSLARARKGLCPDQLSLSLLLLWTMNASVRVTEVLLFSLWPKTLHGSCQCVTYSVNASTTEVTAKTSPASMYPVGRRQGGLVATWQQAFNGLCHYFMKIFFFLKSRFKHSLYSYISHLALWWRACICLYAQVHMRSRGQ